MWTGRSGAVNSPVTYTDCAPSTQPAAMSVTVVPVARTWHLCPGEGDIPFPASLGLFSTYCAELSFFFKFGQGV
jgi:hypothetical protein